MAAGKRTPVDELKYPGLQTRQLRDGSLVYENRQWNRAQGKNITRTYPRGFDQEQAIERWEKERPQARTARKRGSMKMETIAAAYFQRVEKKLNRPATSRDPIYSKRRRRRGVGSERTKGQYLNDWEKFVKPYFGHLYAHQVTADLVTEWLDWLYEQPGKKAGSTFAELTVNGKLTVLRVLLNQAKLEGAVDFNVFEHIDPDDLPDQAPRDSYERNVLRIQELLELIAAAPTPEKRIIIILLAFTGMRRAELVALLWKEIDIEKLVLRLRKSLAPLERGKDPRRVDLKGKWQRDVIALPRVTQALEALRLIEEEKGCGRPGDYALTALETPGRPLSHERITKVVREAAILAGLMPDPELEALKDPDEDELDERPAVTPKTLRRTTATIFAEARIPKHKAARMLGHSEEVYDECYVQCYEDEQEREELIERLGLLGFGTLEEEL